MQEVEGDDGGSETPYNRPHLTGSHLYRQFNPSGPTLTHFFYNNNNKIAHPKNSPLFYNDIVWFYSGSVC